MWRSARPHEHQPADLDLTLPVHTFGAGVRLLGSSDIEQRRTVRPGSTVRLRLVNTDSSTETFRLYGVRARLAAVDGADINEPADVMNPSIDAAGGRYDLSFRGGTPSAVYSVSGRAFPDVPAQLVRRGDTVGFTVVNRGLDHHPMHPHGHHVPVLSRNGEPSTGSPLWMDTFNVGPGEVREVALLANNPGIWMDHCHNLFHASAGMMFHLAYEGVTTPFEVGPATPNHPG